MFMMVDYVKEMTVKKYWQVGAFAFLVETHAKFILHNLCLKERTLLYHIIKVIFIICFHSEAYEQISFKLAMNIMLSPTKVCSLMPI